MRNAARAAIADSSQPKWTNRSLSDLSTSTAMSLQKQPGPDHLGRGAYTPKRLSFRRLGALTFGAYSVANVVTICLLMAQVSSSPFEILLFLALIGPPGLALIILALWCDTKRPGRSGVALALLLAGAAGIALLNLLLFGAAVASA